MLRLNLEPEEGEGLAAYELKARPFLKWAGGKARLIDAIRPLIPKRFKRYIEPFVGGGALFFSIYPKSAILADSNAELMNCYQVVKDNPTELLGWLERFSKLDYDSKTYYEIRSWTVPDIQRVKRAARLIYLNRTAYNGLYRVNREGKFNAPFGGYKTLALPSSKVIKDASLALQNAQLKTGDFKEILESFAGKGDFVYLDPPYPPVSRYSDFNRYTKDFFSEKDHRRLSEQIKQLHEMGASFILSNAEHPLIRELYDDGKFKVIEVFAPRYINCKGDKRGNVAELLITNNTAN